MGRGPGVGRGRTSRDEAAEAGHGRDSRLRGEQFVRRASCRWPSQCSRGS